MISARCNRKNGGSGGSHATLVIPADKGAACSFEERDDTTVILRELLRKYAATRSASTVNFRRILPKLNALDRFTHLIHPYPAKLLVHIPRFFLSNEVLSKPGDWVLDPFCGSGTVLLEALLAGRNALGVDVNPMARLIARVKTNRISAVVLRRHLAKILKGLAASPSGELPDVVNLNHWFFPHVIRQLRCIREAIFRETTGQVQEFFLLCFSACVRKVSLADPRLSVPVRLKLGQYPKKHPLRAKSDRHLKSLRHVNVLNVFRRICESNIERANKLHGLGEGLTAARIVSSDARKLIDGRADGGRPQELLGDESIQLIITSPPYPGAQKYIRSSSLSLGWLNLASTDSLRDLKGLAIGREEFTRQEQDVPSRVGIAAADRALERIRKKSPERAAIASTYLREMRKSIQEMARVLRRGGYLVLVAANNRIAGVEFKTVKFLETLAGECGLETVACLIDAIKSRGLMTKRNDTASVITREWVLIFRKGEG